MCCGSISAAAWVHESVVTRRFTKSSLYPSPRTQYALVGRGTRGGLLGGRSRRRVDRVEVWADVNHVDGPSDVRSRKPVTLMPVPILTTAPVEKLIEHSVSMEPLPPAPVFLSV